MGRGRGAVFLDRDGVINRERGAHTWRLEDFELLPDVAQALNAVHGAGRLAIVVSNQSGIALGLYDQAAVEAVHAYLHRQLARQGAQLDAMYYCPHHPEQGRCLCRKPGSLLFERAVARLGLDVTNSLMVGDRERDIEAAEAVGIRGVLVPPNEALLPVLNKEGMTS
jgi:D-glycero-D-manno-heptose 1,7-bisphosphate phosphatase